MLFPFSNYIRVTKFKSYGMESYEQCGQGRSYCSLCTLDTIHRLFFVTRLIIIKINKVQWVDFKLENVLVSLHSLKIMEPRPIVL